MYGRSNQKEKKKPEKKMKECPNGECQHEVPKRVSESKKIKPKEVFASTPKKGKVPKGSHRMPDGSIMKDKDMTKSKGRKKSGY